MFLGSSSGYEIRVARHQMQLHLVHSLQLLQQLLPLLLRAQKLYAPETKTSTMQQRCYIGCFRALQ